jgi:hypothetical protein
MTTKYRHTGVWVLPALLLAAIIAWPFSFLLGGWAMLIGLPAAAAVLFLLDRVDFIKSDLGMLAVILLLFEVGVFVALLVKLAKGQAEAVGWWLPVVEGIALVAALRIGVRALRGQRRRGKELALEDLTLPEARKVMTLGKVAVEHAGRLLAERPGVDRTAAVGDLRRRIKRRPELGPVVAAAISERRRVWGWVADDPRAAALAVDLIDEAMARAGDAAGQRPGR